MNYKTKAKDSFKTKLNLFFYNLSKQNRHKFTLKDFQSFQITEELAHEYATIYWQRELGYAIKGKPIKKIYEDIEQLKKNNEMFIQECKQDYISNTFPSKFPEAKFIELIKVEQCYYCEITKSEIETLATYGQLNKKNLRGWNLEIDRLNSNFEYTPQNCVMCCYWCNNAKTDEFTEEEFKRISQSIKTIWKERIERARFQERFMGDIQDITIIKNEE